MSAAIPFAQIQVKHVYTTCTDAVSTFRTMERHERLRWARERKFKSAQKAAEAHRWTIPTYQAHENGNRGFKRDDARVYAKAFGVRLAWLEHEDGPPMKVGRAQYGGAVGAGEKIISPDVTNPETVDAPPDILNPVAYDIRGDSMMPRYEHGWRIFVSRRPCRLSSVVNRDCVVQLREGEVYLKKIVRGAEPGKFRLRSFAGVDDIEIAEADVDWVAPVEYTKPSGG